jgi:hypothetical protein
VIAIALLAVTAAGFAYGTTADAATTHVTTVGSVGSVPTGSGSLAPPLGALGESIDALLDALLPHPDRDDDSDGAYGDDPYRDGPQFNGPQFDDPQFDGRYEDGPRQVSPQFDNPQDGVQHDGAQQDRAGRDGRDRPA